MNECTISSDHQYYLHVAILVNEYITRLDIPVKMLSIVQKIKPLIPPSHEEGQIIADIHAHDSSPLRSCRLWTLKRSLE